MKKHVFVFAAIIILIAGSCTTKEILTETPCTNGVNATIVDMRGLDACTFALQLENGKKLEPINLKAFDVEIIDGQKVCITYHSVEMVSICMVGEIVELDSMTER
jgi:hypothetical protein